jgi:3-deoxy-manno-octulosonate cytidylyltransferase (CMP-KDO synthetase)
MVKNIFSDFLVVIPARMNSKRLPNKPLIKILGKEILLRTYQQCLKAVDGNKILIATDSRQIIHFCKLNSINSVKTSSKCLTGTDRVAEVAKKIKKKFYINVQGDEPIFNPKDLKKIIEHSRKNQGLIINGYSKILNQKDYNNPNIPKAVVSNDNFLIYMSRSPIPGNKLNQFKYSHRQICIYSFPRNLLLKFSKSKKTFNEKIEDIEILRFLDLGYKVKMVKMSNDSISVDTNADLKKVKVRLFK